MSFYGNSFIFDNQVSEKYNLTIWSPDGSETSSPASTNVELITEQIYRRPTEYLLGVQMAPVAEFEVNFISPIELDALEIRAISKWLFGKQSFARLVIAENDLENVYYNCLFIDPKIYRVGNIIRGVSATVHCDSPWGWTFPKTLTHTIATAGRTLNFVNLSDHTGYLYPSMTLTSSSFGGTVSITNTSDSNRIFTFTSLSANEVLTINNDLKTISSSTGLYRLGNFNKNWLRFVPGRNALTITGEISSLTLTYQFARKITG